MQKLFMAALAGAILIGFGGAMAQDAGKAKGKGKGTKDPAAAFQKRDKNGDSALDLTEFEGKKGGEKAQARFKKFDKNGDGKVTLAEFTDRGPKKKKKNK